METIWTIEILGMNMLQFTFYVGMVLAVDAADVDKTLAAIGSAKESAYVIGEIKDGEKGVTLC